MSLPVGVTASDKESWLKASCSCIPKMDSEYCIHSLTIAHLGGTSIDDLVAFAPHELSRPVDEPPVGPVFTANEKRGVSKSDPWHVIAQSRHINLLEEKGILSVNKTTESEVLEFFGIDDVEAIKKTNRGKKSCNNYRLRSSWLFQHRQEKKLGKNLSV